MLEGLTCVYRSNVDLFFYVVGSAQENEVGSDLFKSVVFWKVECTLKLIDKLDANAALESKLLFGLFTESLQCDLLYTECVSLKCTGRFMLVLFLQLILVSVLNCLYDSVSHMLRKNVEKRALIDNMDGIFLAIDEICDNG